MCAVYEGFTLGYMYHLFHLEHFVQEEFYEEVSSRPHAMPLTIPGEPINHTTLTFSVLYMAGGEVDWLGVDMTDIDLSDIIIEQDEEHQFDSDISDGSSDDGNSSSSSSDSSGETTLVTSGPKWL